MLAALDQGYADPRRLHTPGPQRAADPRQRPGGRRGGAGRPPGRGLVHLIGNRRRAPGTARAGTPRGDRRPLRGRALRRAARPGLALGPAAAAAAGRRHRAGRPRAAGRLRRPRPPGRQPRGRHAAAGAVGVGHGLPDAGASMGRLPLREGWSVTAGLRAQVGRAGRRRGAARPQGRALAQPVPRRRPGRRAGERVRERPGGARRRRSPPGGGGGARRGQRPPARPGRPDPRDGRRDPGHGGGRRPRRTGSPTW